MKNGVLLTATLLGSLLISAQAVAGASANIGATSNYIWRGMAQSQDKGAVQAGLDYSAENGVYVGAWTSTVDFGDTDYKGSEVDVYAGYKKELPNGVSYDVGAIQYAYPSEDYNYDFTEVYGKLGYKGVGAEVSYTVDKELDTPYKNDVYYAVGYTGKLPNDFSYGVKVGKYDWDDPSADDTDHSQISLTKTVGKAGDFTLAVDKTDKGSVADFYNGTDDTRVSLSWKKSFDF
jgi:uncharacterized protein (TIGR02001 family)